MSALTLQKSTTKSEPPTDKITQLHVDGAGDARPVGVPHPGAPNRRISAAWVHRRQADHPEFEYTILPAHDETGPAQLSSTSSSRSTVKEAFQRLLFDLRDWKPSWQWLRAVGWWPR